MKLPFETATLERVPRVARDHYIKTDTGYRLDLTGPPESPEEMHEQIRASKLGLQVALDKINKLEKLALEPPPELPPIPVFESTADDIRLEKECADKLAEHEAGIKANIASLRSDRDSVALERTAVAIAAKLNPACVELLRPHILERLVASDVGGVFAITARGAPSLEHLTEQFRADPKFARVIVGASAVDKARHQQKVNETLGLAAAPVSVTRADFERLTPDKRAAFARGGGKISDG